MAAKRPLGNEGGRTAFIPMLYSECNIDGLRDVVLLPNSLRKWSGQA